MKITPEIIIRAYASGLFPMADPDQGGEISWYAPDPRAVIPLDGFKTTKNLRKLIRSGPFEVRLDTVFETVMRCCAERTETWISEELIQLYSGLFQFGFAHSVECWVGAELVGGLYGVALGGAFLANRCFTAGQALPRLRLSIWWNI